MTDWSTLQAPSLDEFEALAVAALESLPQPFRALCKDVRCYVSEFPENDVLDELGIESEFDLMGLFTGVGMAQEGITPTGRMPNTVHLYRRPILDYWAEMVAHLVDQHMGDHGAERLLVFGPIVEDMEALEEQAALEKGN